PIRVVGEAGDHGRLIAAPDPLARVLEGTNRGSVGLRREVLADEGDPHSRTTPSRIWSRPPSPTNADPVRCRTSSILPAPPAGPSRPRDPGIRPLRSAHGRVPPPRAQPPVPAHSAPP